MLIEGEQLTRGGDRDEAEERASRLLAEMLSDDTTYEDVVVIACVVW